MTQRSKSTLFLIEQLIVIAVFAICAVACISILTAAYFNASDSKATSQAIIRAEATAEAFKAVGGDGPAVLDIMGSTQNRGMKSGYPAFIIYYDHAWQVSNEENAEFALFLAFYPETDQNSGIVRADLTVEKITGEELVAFPLAARRR